jgi:hypothetical protein
MEGFKKTENDLVSSDKIRDAKKQDAVSILGRQPKYVRKVPFQFQQLPFFDTAHFCDPADAG